MRSIETRVEQIVHDSTPAHYTRRWVLPSILPLVVLTGLYAYFVAVMYISWGWKSIALSNSIVPVLSVVLGLLLAFRANTSYARYYEGRQLWQDLSSNTRNLARLVWCSIPERTQNDHLEKMRCMKLLLAFAVATKHYLRRELGIDYYDLDYLLPPNWIPAAADDRLFIIKDESSDDEGIVVSTLKHNGTKALLDVNQGGDDIHDIENQPCPSTGPSSSAVSTIENSHTSTINNDEDDHHQPQKKKRKFVSDEDLPDEGNSDMSLPLEIIFRLSLYMEQAKQSGKIDGQFSNVIITHLNNLNDCLSGMERIVNTPIPAVYVVHLKQSVVLYILAIPFTLIDQLNWWIIPTLVLAAFVLFGIDAIGAQIDNPFGYNSNDFPLNTFCDALRKEIEFIVYHLPCETENAMMI
ncbi:Bestrophin, RFP-TM, chloride channel-domain-containing protein [Gilbertella persicaria]|uniref:Bestrophin, RFP-TM, chloride channel-domain-containing protein n=1 Tax=Gilbertella persicaria TaxID=101096 RepID=UPI00221E7206|nr:Bestrophin, RFP-TM, chloride channel-domain-containing protein [Gilbertella persicaria]KAI8079632.1 Bestrophin, RFP-TM, chloride channel-domain-containing protein [Gilbertella persicaria]